MTDPITSESEAIEEMRAALRRIMGNGHDLAADYDNCPFCIAWNVLVRAETAEKAGIL